MNDEKKKIDSIERRTIQMDRLTVLEKRDDSAVDSNVDSSDVDEQPVIEGHAAVFNEWSETLYGTFKERILPGAFTESILEDDIRALFNHNCDYVLGRNAAGTLELQEDEKGLFVKITPPDTTWGRDLIVSIKRGDITQMSIGFCCTDDSWDTEDGVSVREIKKCKLYDVSPVTFPAYTQTDASVRSAEDVYKEHLKKAEELQNEKKLELLKRNFDFI